MAAPATKTQRVPGRRSNGSLRVLAGSCSELQFDGRYQCAGLGILEASGCRRNLVAKATIILERISLLLQAEEPDFMSVNRTPGIRTGSNREGVQ